MGIRAYVVKQGNEYDGNEYFRNLMPEVMEMLHFNEITYEHVWERHSEHDASWVIDCKSGALQQYVAKLETLQPDEVHEDFRKCHNQYTNEDVLKILKAWLRCIDPKENVIKIHWH